MRRYDTAAATVTDKQASKQERKEGNNPLRENTILHNSQHTHTHTPTKQQQQPPNWFSPGFFCFVPLSFSVVIFFPYLERS